MNAEPASPATPQVIQARQWFDNDRETLETYAMECCADYEAAIAHVKRNLRQCRATSRETFVLWAVNQIARQPGFGGSMDAIRGLDLDVLAFFNAAEQQADFKPLTSMRTPTTLLIDMGKGNVWKVPTNQTVTIRDEDRSWATVAERLWPVYLRKVGKLYQVTKVIKGQHVHLARIFLGARDDQMVKFDNGDTLDYTGCNPYIVSDSVKSTSQAQARFERATLKCTGWDMENVTADPVDAKPKRPKGEGPTDGGSELSDDPATYS